MAGPYDLTGQNIEDTYQRILQTPDGSAFYDGTGSLVTLPTANTASLLTTASLTSNILTFTKGNGSTFDVTIESSSYALSSSYAVTASYTLTASYSQQASDIVLLVLNQTGVQINKGAVVRVSGSNNSSDIPRISLADWTNDNLSANTLGLAMSDIANGDTGYVLTEGVFKGYDTSTPGWAPGQVLYLGPSGSITGSAPQAPLHGVRLGQVIRVQQNNGSIYVRIDNGYELDELHNVLITNVSNGDLLTWNNSSSVWINSKTLSGSYNLSGSLTTNNGITSSLFGTSSWAENALTASYVLNAISSSYSDTASYVNPLNQTVEITGSLNVTGSQIYLETDAFNILYTPSNTVLIEADNIGVNIYDTLGQGSIDAETRYLYSTTAISVDWQNRQLFKSDGSTIALDWENLTARGANGNDSINWGGNSKFLYDVNGVNSIEWNGRHVFDTQGSSSIDWSNRQLLKSDGSTISVDWENGILTGSLHGTSSWAENALTASYVNGIITKANVVNAGVFGGIPLTASITFNTAFPNINYSIIVTGEDARLFTVQNKLVGGFEINTNSSVALTGNTYWHAISYGEFNG